MDFKLGHYRLLWISAPRRLYRIVFHGLLESLTSGPDANSIDGAAPRQKNKPGNCAASGSIEFGCGPPNLNENVHGNFFGVLVLR